MAILMKRPIFKKIGGVLKSLLTGAVVTPTRPILGAILGAVNKGQEILDDNIKRKEGGEGQIDYAEIIGLSITILLILLFAFDVITLDEFMILNE